MIDNLPSYPVHVVVRRYYLDGDTFGVHRNTRLLVFLLLSVFWFPDKV